MATETSGGTPAAGAVAGTGTGGVGATTGVGAGGIPDGRDQGASHAKGLPARIPVQRRNKALLEKGESMTSEKPKAPAPEVGENGEVVKGTTGQRLAAQRELGEAGTEAPSKRRVAPQGDNPARQGRRAGSNE